MIVYRFNCVKFALLLAMIAPCARPVSAAIDTLQTVVPGGVGTGGAAIATFGYNPFDDTMYVSGFGASGELRKVSNVGGAQTVETLVTQTEYQLYLRDGDGTRGVTTAMQHAIMFNPVTLGTGPNAIAPYGIAIINDAATTRFPSPPGNTTTQPIDPAVTKRLYTFNLQSADGDARNVFDTLVTLQDMQAVVGTTETTTNHGRQGAWSGDGQSIYFTATGSAFTGLWKMNAVTGAVQRLSAETDVLTEVAATTAAVVDTIYLRGGGSTANAGGIDKFTHDGATTSSRTVALSAGALRDFLEVSASNTPQVASMAADAEGNLYFNNTTSSPERRGIFKLDTEGRLSKVVSYAERDYFFTGTPPGTAPNANSNTLRMQPRTVAHPTAGSIPQILYAENVTDDVAGAYVFEVGDFNRDGDVTSADYAMLSAPGVIQTRGGAAIANEDHYRFDLNANSLVDWKDVKILQQFTGFATGDVNFDSVLDLVDLDVLGANYYTTANPSNKTWTAGDLGSIDPLYAPSAADANIVNAADVNLFADAWFNLEQPITESQLTSRGYTGQFLDDVLAAFGFTGGLAGDFDGDGDVDGADFLDWQTQVGAAVTPGTGADANSDGMVDGLDLAEWTANYGDAASSGAAAVPEPAAALLMAVAFAAIGFRRCRPDAR